LANFLFMKWLLLIFLALALSACQATPTPTADISPPPTVSPLPESNFTETSPLETPVPLMLPETAGLRVVYIKDGMLWHWQNGSPVSLSAKASALALSDDGRVVAFLSGGHLWAIDLAGGEPRQLENLAASQVAADFAFQPGAHTLYFTTQSQGIGTPIPQNDLYAVDADQPVLRALLPAGQGGRFSFAPDGAQLALIQPDRINVANLDGSGLKTVLTFAPVLKADGQAYLPPVAWLSNSYGFKTVIPNADSSQPARFMFMAAQGGEPAQLALIRAAPVAMGYYPYISASSDTVAYLRENGSSLELHTIDASTADKTLLTHPKDQFGLLGWAGDGVSLVYWINDPSQTQLRHPDGSTVPLGGAQIVWLDAAQYLSLSGNELRLTTLGQPGIVIDTGNITEFSGVILR